MTPQERKDKILEVAQGDYLTVADISRAAFGNTSHIRRCREIILGMVRDGAMEKGDNVLLQNQMEVATFRATPGGPPGQRAADFFHGRAPSVFQWRGNFGLRS
jgi:hypothetical protein